MPVDFDSLMPPFEMGWLIGEDVHKILGWTARFSKQHPLFMLEHRIDHMVAGLVLQRTYDRESFSSIPELRARAAEIEANPPLRGKHIGKPE